MSRKQNPDDVVAEFTERLARDLDNWRAQHALLDGELQRSSSVDAFFRAATAFEAFRSDWHVSAINRDSSNLLKRLELAKAAVFRGRSDYPGLAGSLRLEFPVNPSLEKIREVLDPQGAHLAFGSVHRWVERSRDELNPDYARKVRGLSKADKAFVATVVALRNFVAHRSVRASGEFNAARVALDANVDRHLIAGTRKIHPSGIGQYLNAQQPTGRRVELYFARLGQVADRMRI